MADEINPHQALMTKDGRPGRLHKLAKEHWCWRRYGPAHQGGDIESRRSGGRGVKINQLMAALGVVVYLSVSPALADQFDDGSKAASRGEYGAAIQAWRPLAEQGSARAQTALGFMYANGQGVPKDYAEALKWYRMAAEQGYAEAQYLIGVMFSNGLGVPKDDAEAEKWFRMKAEQGDASAQYDLGNMYANGQGVPHDDAEALKWYRMAAEQGYADAQLNLGLKYANGLEGVLQDYGEAVKWFRMAAEQGNPDAQYNLGNMYAKGQGVPQDPVQAHMWFNLSAAGGKTVASVERDIAATHMTTDQINEAQKMAREWMAVHPDK